MQWDKDTKKWDEGGVFTDEDNSNDNDDGNDNYYYQKKKTNKIHKPKKCIYLF